MKLNGQIRQFIWGGGLIFLSSCATPTQTPKNTSLLPAPKAGIQTSSIVTSTKHFELGSYSSSAWVSESFSGAHARQFQGNQLHFGVQQKADEGGLDVGLSLSEDMSRPVFKAKKDLRVCSAYNIQLDGKGRWWAGPKISVNWQGDEAAKENGDDWYENYIVEIASSSPAELHEIFTDDYFKAEELPSTEISGSTYRHYKIRFHSWWQFWSVRQDYRQSGNLEIEPIIDVWIENGLPQNRIFDGVKANIETYGEIKGTGRLRMNATHDPSFNLTCD